MFQHIPDPDVIRRYVVEAGRVLRPVGVFKFLVKTRDWVREPPEKGTWNGASVSESDVNGWGQEAGLDRLSAYSLDEHLAWVVLQAPPAG